MDTLGLTVVLEQFSKAVERRDHEHELKKERQQHENEQNELKSRIKELQHESWLLQVGDLASSALGIGLTFFATKSQRQRYKIEAQKLGVSSYYLHIGNKQESMDSHDPIAMMEKTKHELNISHGIIIATAFHMGANLAVLKQVGVFSPEEVAKSPWLPDTPGMMKDYLSVLNVDEKVILAVCQFWIEWYEKKHLQPPGGELFFYLLYLYLFVAEWNRTKLQTKFPIIATEIPHYCK